MLLLLLLRAPGGVSAVVFQFLKAPGYLVFQFIKKLMFIISKGSWLFSISVYKKLMFIISKGSWLFSISVNKKLMFIISKGSWLFSISGFKNLMFIIKFLLGPTFTFALWEAPHVFSIFHRF